MMKIPYTREKLMQAQIEVVRANGHEACYIRPIAFYGSEKMGVSPVGAKVHVAIAAWPWGAYLGPEALAKGIRVKTSSYARHHVNVTMARAKMSGTYPNSVLATLEATQHGYDEGLLLDVDGFVAEGAGENIFIVKDGKHLRAGAHLGAHRHHARLGDRARRRARLRGDLAPAHARRHLHRRRGLLHRHRGGGDADPRARRRA